MGTVHWSVAAHKSLEEIADYIAQDSPFYAVQFAEGVLDYVDKLHEFPKIGRVVPEFGKESIRERIFHNYRIVYRIQGDDVSIVAVCHGSVDIRGKAGREGWAVS